MSHQWVLRQHIYVVDPDLNGCVVRSIGVMYAVMCAQWSTTCTSITSLRKVQRYSQELEHLKHVNADDVLRVLTRCQVVYVQQIKEPLRHQKIALSDCTVVQIQICESQSQSFLFRLQLGRVNLSEAEE